jgi:predicted N-acetyltransferase YhbS
VLPEFRGHGIAKQLVQRALDDLLPVADAIMLATGIPDFYRRFGFESLGAIRNADAPAGAATGDTLMILRNEVRTERGAA